MMVFGLLLGPSGIRSLAVLAEANHPAGGSNDTGSIMRFAGVLVAIGAELRRSGCSWRPPRRRAQLRALAQTHDHLASRFDERPVAGGIVNDRAIAQLFVSRGSTSPSSSSPVRPRLHASPAATGRRRRRRRQRARISRWTS